MTGPTDLQIHSFLAHHGREHPRLHWPRVSALVGLVVFWCVVVGLTLSGGL